jgi:hypothetical protein
LTVASETAAHWGDEAASRLRQSSNSDSAEVFYVLFRMGRCNGMKTFSLNRSVSLGQF